MSQPNSYSIILLLILLSLPLVGQSIGRSFGDEVTSVIGALIGLLCSILVAFIWVKLARTEHVAMLAGLTATCATVQSLSMTTAKHLSGDMRLMTTVACFLLAWFGFNKLFNQFVIELPEDAVVSTTTDSAPESSTSSDPHSLPNS